MKFLNKFLVLVIFATIFLSACSKSDENPNENPNVTVNSSIVTMSGFNYKKFYLEPVNSTNLKGLIIMAHGDGSNENDGTLNDQCTDLAKEGYIAITTSYRSLAGLNWQNQVAQFKTDMSNVIDNAGIFYNIPLAKTIVGGTSRGGVLNMELFLPNGSTPGITPYIYVKGGIFQCSGGDAWKGRNMQFPVAWMSNQVDNTMGVGNASDFKNGLLANSDTSVKTLSECLIYNSTGHCSDISGNKAFIIKKVKEWLP